MTFSLSTTSFGFQHQGFGRSVSTNIFYPTGKRGTGCVMEVVCSHDLWIWHLFVGNPGSVNDLNILERSPLLQQLYYGTTPQVSFTLSNHQYQYPYWLCDGIYPRLASFVLAFAKPNTEIDRNFTFWQESTQKDIERAFGVLQAQWRNFDKSMSSLGQRTTE